MKERSFSNALFVWVTSCSTTCRTPSWGTWFILVHQCMHRLRMVKIFGKQTWYVWSKQVSVWSCAHVHVQSLVIKRQWMYFAEVWIKILIEICLRYKSIEQGSLRMTFSGSYWWIIVALPCKWGLVTISAANCHHADDAEGISVVHFCSYVERVHFRNYVETLTSDSLEGGLWITSCDLLQPFITEIGWLRTR